jgi:hypothetical protein
MIGGRPQTPNTTPPIKAPLGRPEQLAPDAFVPSISVDDLKGGAPPGHGHRGSVAKANNQQQQAFSANWVDPVSSASHVRLAARGITEHLVQHLWHFPLGLGASHLGSLVLETDDGLIASSAGWCLHLNYFSSFFQSRTKGGGGADAPGPRALGAPLEKPNVVKNFTILHVFDWKTRCFFPVSLLPLTSSFCFLSFHQKNSVDEYISEQVFT